MTMGKMCKKLSSEKNCLKTFFLFMFFCIIHIYSNKSSSWCYTKALQTVCRSLHFCVKDTKFLETENDYFIQYTNTSCSDSKIGFSLNANIMAMVDMLYHTHSSCSHSKIFRFYCTNIDLLLNKNGKWLLNFVDIFCYMSR